MDRSFISNIYEVNENNQTLPDCFESCPRHKFQALKEINLNEDGNDLIFKCSKCISQDGLMDTVSIKEIVYSEDNPGFDELEGYLSISSELKQKIKDILSSHKQQQSMVEYVQNYFKNLRIQILDLINKMEDQFITKAAQIDDLKENLEQQLNRLSNKKGLREIILDNNSIDQKSEKAKAFIKDQLKTSEEVEQSLQLIMKSAEQSTILLKINNLIDYTSIQIHNCLDKLNQKELKKEQSQMQINQIQKVK